MPKLAIVSALPIFCGALSEKLSARLVELVKIPIPIPMKRSNAAYNLSQPSTPSTFKCYNAQCVLSPARLPNHTQHEHIYITVNEAV